MIMSMMGRMFGGVIAEIMGGSVAREEAEMLEFLSNFLEPESGNFNMARPSQPHT